jgi:hypothetical protein
VCCCPVCSIDLGCAPLEKLRFFFLTYLTLINYSFALKQHATRTFTFLYVSFSCNVLDLFYSYSLWLMSTYFLYRIDHSLQYVRSKVFPSKKRKVEDPEVTSPITSPIKTKVRSLSSLTKHAPQMSMQKCLRKRRTKASCLQNLPLVCNFSFTGYP